MTEDDKALVKQLGAQKNNQLNAIEAMARIEQLTAEVERLRQFARNAERCAAHGLAGDWSIALHDIKRNARAALEGKQ